MVAGIRRTIGLLLAPVLLALGAPPASAQVSIETESGWIFTFAGNASAFMVYERESPSGQVPCGETSLALVCAGRAGSAVRTGLLPAFAVFDLRRTESGLALGAHFGFAAQIQTPGGHDNQSDTQAGARLDLRQAYLTVGGPWGQILAGREIGLYLRQNILTDQTLFGVGATGGNFGNPAGTTLGRSGFGYIYPNFNAQFTYSTPADRPLEFAIGLFDPSTNEGFDRVVLPRLETELTYSRGAALFWISGLLQHHTDTLLDRGATAWGASGGARVALGPVALVGSGYLGTGIGTTLLFNGGRSDVPGSTRLRPSRGFLAQLGYTVPNTGLTVAASYGRSIIRGAADEPDVALMTNSSVTAGAYVQATRSLKLVGEATFARSDDSSPATHANHSVAAAVGMMLFF